MAYFVNGPLDFFARENVKKNQYFDRDIPVILAGESMEKNQYFDTDIPVISARENTKKKLIFS